MEIQAIKSHLKAVGMTYETLSERSGIPLNTLKNIFRGKTKNPRIDTMQAIESALGLSPTQWTEEEKSAGVIRNYKESLSADEVELLDAYRAMNDQEVKELSNYIAFILSKRKNT